MQLKEIKEVKTQEEARQIGIDVQIFLGEESMSYGELAEYTDYLEELADKFDLKQEFAEIGMCE